MYSDFCNQVYAGVMECFAGEDVKVELGEARSISRTGTTLTVVRGNLGAVFYLSSWENDSTVDEAVKSIVQSSQLTEGTLHVLEGIKECVQNTEYVKEHVAPVLLNTARNVEKLENLVSREFFDLSLVYRVDTSELKKDSSVYVTKELLRTFEFSEEELWKQARKNCVYECISFEEVVKQFGADCIPDEVSMFILRTKFSTGGAFALLNDKLLQQVAAQLDNDLILIPSSIYEIIALPALYEFGTLPAQDELSAIEDMVKSVNDTVLEAKDLLSYNVYTYSRKDHLLRCKGFEPIDLRF